MFHHIDVRPKKNKGNKVISLVGKILEWGIFGVIITAFFVVASPILPTKNFISTYIVTSGSMEPKVLAGSVALVRPARENSLKVGDVIAFTSPQDANQTILHRISSLADGAIKTKGDNNNAADGWTIYPSSVKGRMIFTVPYIGHTAALMRTPVGFGLMMGLPVFLFMVFMFKQIKEGFEEEIEKKTKRALEKIASLEPARIMVFLAFLLAGFSLGFAGSQTVLAKYTSLATISGLSLRVKDFVPPPAPTLLLPLNDSYVNTSGLVMDWSDVTDFENMSGPVYYIYQSARNPGFSPSAYLSGKLYTSYIPASGTSDGQYWWKVKACDQLDNCSGWSVVWHMTVDSTKPSNFSLLSAGGHSPVNPQQGDIYTNASSPLMEWADTADTNFDHYEYVVYTTDVDTQTERNTPVCPIWGCSYNGANLNPPTSPLTSSFYQAGNTGDGIYFWRVYAFDKAGNRTLSNAAGGNNYTWKVIVDTQPPSTTISTPSDGVSFTTSPITISGQTTDNRAINTVSLSYTTFNGTSCDSTYLPIDVLTNPSVSPSYSWSYNWDPGVSGKYCVKASGTDYAGNSEHSPVVENIFYHVLPQLQLTSTDDKHTISFDISDVSSFVSLGYKLTYLADGKDEGLEGTIAINGSTQIVRDLSTGYCSTDGCSFPTEIKEIKLQITLTDDMGYKSQLEKSL